MSHVLYPPDLDLMGLVAAIQWHTARTSELSGIDITLNLPTDLGRLPNEIEIALFRVFQESLENVRRHSGAPWPKCAWFGKRRESCWRLKIKGVERRRAF